MRFIDKTFYFVSYLLLATFLFACNSDTEDEIDGTVAPIELGDPTLNRFIITAEDELVVRVDAATGEDQIVFEFARLNGIASLPDYHDGMVYVATDDNSVNAIDIASGQFQWDVPMPEYDLSSLTKSGTVYDDGLVYCMGHTGVMVAVDAISGETIWTFSMHPDGVFDGFFSSGGIPVIRDDRLYMLTEESIFGAPAYLYILNKKTGELLHQLELPNDFTGILKFADNTILIPAGDLYAVDIETFDILWRTEFSGVATPIVSGNRVFVHAVPASNDNFSSSIYALDLSSGAILWEQEAGFDRVRAPVVVGDVVLVVFEEAKQVAGIRSGRPMALDATTGEVRWLRDDFNISGSPVVANGRLFFHGYEILSDLDDSRGLYCFDAATGEAIWFNDTFGSGGITPIVIADNGSFGPGYYQE